MAQRFGSRRTRIEGQFSALVIDMLRSPARRVLSKSARMVLDRLEIEIADHGGKDNGSLPCTYEHFHEFGIDDEAIAPAIREVEALGFVEITQRGTGGNREFRRPSLYRLTYKHTDFAGPTDEWRRITSTEEAKRIAKDARGTDRKTKNHPGKTGVKPPREIRGETPKSPPREIRGTVLPREIRGTSISRDDPFLVSRERARSQSAVASEAANSRPLTEIERMIVADLAADRERRRRPRGVPKPA